MRRITPYSSWQISRLRREWRRLESRNLYDSFPLILCVNKVQSDILNSVLGVLEADGPILRLPQTFVDGTPNPALKEQDVC